MQEATTNYERDIPRLKVAYFRTHDCTQIASNPRRNICISDFNAVTCAIRYNFLAFPILHIGYFAKCARIQYFQLFTLKLHEHNESIIHLKYIKFLSTDWIYKHHSRCTHFYEFTKNMIRRGCPSEDAEHTFFYTLIETNWEFRGHNIYTNAAIGQLIMCLWYIYIRHKENIVKVSLGVR